jgi:hypothetical protein
MVSPVVVNFQSQTIQGKRDPRFNESRRSVSVRLYFVFEAAELSLCLGIRRDRKFPTVKGD